MDQTRLACKLSHLQEGWRGHLMKLIETVKGVLGLGGAANVNCGLELVNNLNREK
jgi:hypothetical protein